MTLLAGEATAPTTAGGSEHSGGSGGNSDDSSEGFARFLEVLNSPSKKKKEEEEERDNNAIIHPSETGITADSSSSFAFEDNNNNNSGEAEVAEAQVAVALFPPTENVDDDEVDGEKNLQNVDGNNNNKQKNLPTITTTNAGATINSINDDDDTTDDAVTVKPHSHNGEDVLHFSSLLLFVIGSILYLIMSVEDYRWANELRTYPMWLRPYGTGALDDDSVWVNYKREERYNASLLLLLGEEEEEPGAEIGRRQNRRQLSLLRGRPAATTATMGGSRDESRSGGVRRVKTTKRNEHERRRRRRILLRERAASSSSSVRKMRALRQQQGPDLSSSSSSLEASEKIDEATVHREAHPPRRRQLQTPEEMYYDEDWGDLPPEIRDAFVTLGYDEDLWCNGGGAETDDYGWEEFDEEQLAAALLIGYTEEIWCGEEGGGGGDEVVPAPPVATARPTPRPVTSSPSRRPTPRPVTMSPSRRPTPRPVTDSPTKGPTPGPVTDSPTRRTSRPTTFAEAWATLTLPVPANPLPPTPPSESTPPPPSSPQDEDFLLWDSLAEGQVSSLSLLGYDESLWNSGRTSPAETKPWEELTSEERFGAFFLGFEKETWDAIGGEEEEEGGRFASFRPPSDMNDALLATTIVEETTVTTTTGTPTRAPNPDDPTTGPSVAPAVVTTPLTASEPTDGPSQTPTKTPSLPPTSNPTLSPATVASAKASPVAAPAPVVETPAAATNPSSPASPALADTPATDPDDTAVAVAATPEELYYDEWWKDLPPEVQAAYTLLGANETIWNEGLAAETDTLGWAELAPEMQEAALSIGYTEEIWCTTSQPTGSPTASNGPTVAGDVATGGVAPDDAVLAGPTPDELYGDEYWEDLPPDVQDAYAVLGYDEAAWNFGNEPASNEMGWDELTQEQRDAALSIGYTQLSWDYTTAPTVSPYASLPDTADVAVPAATVPPGFYDNYGWVDLPPNVQDAASALGYSQTLWDTGGLAWSEDADWDDLNPEQQGAAALLGYDKYSWDGIDPVTGAVVFPNATGANETLGAVLPGFYDEYGWGELPPPVQEAASALGYDQLLWDSGGLAWSDDYGWDEFAPEQQEAAAVLGYDKYSWDGIDPVTGTLLAYDDDYVSYDDDYVFQVGPSEADIWVSKYQILYFFAALCSVIVGVLDLIRERHAFHILMILAGFFGLLSSIYIEEDIHLSNVFNSVSVHFFLLEGVTLFGEHKRSSITAEANKWVTGFILFGDVEFALGALIDVILSYFWLLDQTADWDNTLQIASIFAAVLWLQCSLVYMGAFAYDYHETK